MITVRGLTKQYGSRHGGALAVDGISFAVRTGELFGLIGADGAGKTTCFQMLSGVMPPTSGEASLNAEAGYVTQRFSLYPDLSVEENLRYSAGLRRVSKSDYQARSARYLQAFDLERFRDRPAGRLSGGMKQKLALCCALMSAPGILLLDEPTTGVDPVTRQDFWDTLVALAREGVTIVVATPYLREAECCDRIAFLDRGRMVAIDTPGSLAHGSSLEGALVARLEQIHGPAFHEPFPLPRPKPGGQTLLEAASLQKRFGDFRAVRDFSVSIRSGEIYGLLGANGAGKTTAIKMMCGLLTPTGGSVNLLGHTERLRGAAVRSRIGYMSQKFTLYDDLTVGENLDYYANLYNLPSGVRRVRRQWVLEVSGLAGQEKLLTAQLPGGWKQRLAFGAAIMHEPDLLFLDEPTSGVDPAARRSMWRMIGELAANGAGILVVTHYLEEAEQCSKIGVMIAGEMALAGSPSRIHQRHPGRSLEDVFFALVQERRAGA
ncbi:MAG: ABC transporter ATP-binding protein [Acidobacteria bacterium]|nr:ABC transporter ATP-binding protein [Acidobacteriota bacterium]